MKLTVVGGGGFRIPQIVEALSRRPKDQLDVTELCLYDISDERLRVMADVLDQLSIARKPRITVTGDLRTAIHSADFVFSAMRVAGTEGRVRDELIPLRHNVLGQETVGPGGYAYALRTIPAALELAHAVAQEAPGAWVINFTNPAGIITQAMRGVLGKKVIGICDTPIGLVRRAARALGHREIDLDYDYIGLNHLGWLRSIRKDGDDLLPRLLNDPDLLGQMEEARLIGATDLPLAEAAAQVTAFGGVPVPAHINRGANGLLINLGLMPPEPFYSTVEVWRLLPCDEGALRGRHVLHSSDAHYLGDIQEREHALRLREGTTSALLAWMRSVKDI